MSDKIVSDEEARVLRCAYCLCDGKEMVDHRQLKCSHSLCLDCLEKALSSQKECKVFTCPLCIKEHALFSDERDDSFPACPNLVKGEGLLQEANISHCCITCADEGIRRAADTFCNKCENLFCVSHTKMHEEAHNYPSSTVKHELIPVKRYCESKGKFSGKFCPHHPEKKLDGMCVICKEFNCETCRSFNDNCHPGNDHKNKPLKDLEGETTMKLTIAMKPVMRLIEEQKMLLKQSERMIEHKEKEFAQMLVDVDQVMENQLKEIRTKYSQLKTRINELREENIQRKNIYQDQAQEKIEMLQNLIDDVNMSLETKHLVDILQEEAALCEKLTENENVELVSLELANVELRHAERSRSIELQLGSAADSKSPLESSNEKSFEPEANLTSADANPQAERLEDKGLEAKPLLQRNQLENSLQRNKDFCWGVLGISLICLLPVLVLLIAFNKRDREVQCPQLSPSDGWTNISSVPAAPLAGVTVAYFCGFTNTSIFLLCSSDEQNTTGTWNDTFSVCSDEIALGCGPPSIENANFSQPSNLSYGAEFPYECDKFYVPSGPKTALCSENKRWSFVPCEEVRCSQLSSPNGWASISSVPAAPLAGVTVAYFCGFTNTTIILFCLSDGENTTGTWNDTLSVCSDDIEKSSELENKLAVAEAQIQDEISKAEALEEKYLLEIKQLKSSLRREKGYQQPGVDDSPVNQTFFEINSTTFGGFSLLILGAIVAAFVVTTKALEEKYQLEIKQLKASLKREKVENNKKPSVALKKVPVKQTAYCVSHTADGQLVVGRYGGFDFLDESGKILRSVKTPNAYITGLSLYKGHVYVIHHAPSPGTERQVQKYSMQGELTTSWKVPDFKFISQLAVVQDRVYTRSDGDNLLLAYSLTGEQQPQHNIPLPAVPTPNYLCGAPPDGLIISGLTNNLVAKYTASGQQVWLYKCLVQSGLTTPTGASAAFIDEFNRVWVASHDSRIHILSPEGEFICELTVPDVKKPLQLSISGDQLACAAYTDGLLLYSIEY